MSRRVITSILATATAVAVLAIGSGVAAASSPASASGQAAKLRVVSIVMADPGCHWFLVNGKRTTRLAVNGATAFRNLDEAALIVKGAKFNQHIAVGKSLTIAKPGVYHITMVKQAPDDNHLVLVVK